METMELSICLLSSKRRRDTAIGALVRSFGLTFAVTFVLTFALSFALSVAPALARADLSGNDPYSLRNLAFQCYIEGQTEQALSMYQKAIDRSIHEFGSDSTFVADLYFEMGTLAFDAGKEKTAESCLQEAIKRNPNSEMSRIKLAELLRIRSKHDEALTHIRTYLDKHRNSIPARRALVLWLQEKGLPALATQESYTLSMMMRGQDNRIAPVRTPETKLAVNMPPKAEPNAEPKAEPKAEAKPEAQASAPVQAQIPPPAKKETAAPFWMIGKGKKPKDEGKTAQVKPPVTALAKVPSPAKLQEIMKQVSAAAGIKPQTAKPAEKPAAKPAKPKSEPARTTEKTAKAKPRQESKPKADSKPQAESKPQPVEPQEALAKIPAVGMPVPMFMAPPPPPPQSSKPKRNGLVPPPPPMVPSFGMYMPPPQYPPPTPGFKLSTQAKRLDTPKEKPKEQAKESAFEKTEKHVEAMKEKEAVPTQVDPEGEAEFFLDWASVKNKKKK
ncbi:MAG TPA: tetratricopeptide repeat protein [Candidatus Obscuribacterales bacterium]